MIGAVASGIAKNIAAGLWPSLIQGRHNLGMDRRPAIRHETLVLLGQMLAESGLSLEGETTLEMGPGRSPDLMMAFSLVGAGKVYGLDVKAWMPDASWTDAKFREVAGALPSAFRAVFEAGNVEPPSAELPDIEYITYSGSRIPLASDSVALIYSKSVLEHVRVADVETSLREQRRVLKPSGRVAHLIDLRDHCHIRGDHEVHGDWLDALTYPEWLHNAMTSNRPAYINRLRANGWRRMFEAAGLRVLKWEVVRTPLHPKFDLARLDPRLRDAAEDYSISGLNVLLGK